MNADNILSDRTRAQIAADLLLLADLHDRALYRESLVVLWSSCYDGLLALSPRSPSLAQALNTFCQSLTEIPTCFDAETGAALTADYRQIYHSAGAFNGPRQAAWCGQAVDDRKLDRKTLHRWGARRGHPVIAWMENGDDHLATQLRYLACLAAADGIASPTDRLGRYLGQHFLHWIDRFAADVMARCHTRLYPELAGLTAVYLHELGALFDHDAVQVADSPTKLLSMATGLDRQPAHINTQ